MNAGNGPTSTRGKQTFAKAPALNRQIQKRIGQQLCAMYHDVVRQGIPDRFNELLRQIDERTVHKPKWDCDAT
jgi:Anti-sigma factor NepR